MAKPAAAGRGREAGTPREIPGRGWKDILWRVKDEASGDNLSMVAGGVAFYALLALPAALAACVSIYGLVASPETVTAQIGTMSQMLPPDAASLFQFSSGHYLLPVACSPGARAPRPSSAGLPQPPE